MESSFYRFEDSGVEIGWVSFFWVNNNSTVFSFFFPLGIVLWFFFFPPGRGGFFFFFFFKISQGGDAKGKNIFFSTTTFSFFSGGPHSRFFFLFSFSWFGMTCTNAAHSGSTSKKTSDHVEEGMCDGPWNNALAPRREEPEDQAIDRSNNRWPPPLIDMSYSENEGLQRYR